MAGAEWYAVLSVDPRASTGEIRQAFRLAALKYHPDKNAAEAAAAQFGLVHEAFSVLSDPHKRAAYDASIGLVSPLVAEQDRQRHEQAREERQHFATKLAEAMTEHEARDAGASTESAAHLAELRIVTQRKKEELLARRAHNVDCRTVDGHGEPFPSVHAARDYVDHHKGTRLKSSAYIYSFSEDYERATLDRIRNRST